MFAFRAELEFRAGGNPSFNTGVNYERQLGHSVDHAEVEALYVAAGLSLDADLATLNSAPRIAADPGALTYLSDNIIYDGQLTIPVLTLHTTGDGLVPVENERAYKRVVSEANDSNLLTSVTRQLGNSGRLERRYSWLTLLCSLRLFNPIRANPLGTWRVLHPGPARGCGRVRRISRVQHISLLVKRFSG
jgi:hypothetical protein